MFSSAELKTRIRLHPTLSIMRRLEDDETLDWHDLYHRVRRAFPDITAMWFAYAEWSVQRQYYQNLYRRLDLNSKGKMTQKSAMESAKAVLREWKRKH